MRRGSGFADLSYVYAAVEELAPHLNGFTVITTKSTVPVRTSREIKRRLKAIRPDAEFAICSNPEFLREGSAIQDFTHPDRVLVGTDSAPAREVMQRLYKPLSLRNAPVIFVSRKSAELAKYAANTFSPSRLVSSTRLPTCAKRSEPMCRRSPTQLAVTAASAAALHPGPGYGGSCFPKDVSALIRIGREMKSPLSIVEQVQRVNDERKIAMTGRIERAAGGVLRDKTVAVLGVTFKPNTDDMRDAPSLVIVPMLLSAVPKYASPIQRGANRPSRFCRV